MEEGRKVASPHPLPRGEGAGNARPFGVFIVCPSNPSYYRAQLLLAKAVAAALAAALAGRRRVIGLGIDRRFDRAPSCDICLGKRALAHLAKGGNRRGLLVASACGVAAQRRTMGRSLLVSAMSCLGLT